MEKFIFKDDWNKILSASMRNCFQITKNKEKNASRKRDRIEKETNQHIYTLYS